MEDRRATGAGIHGLGRQIDDVTWISWVSSVTTSPAVIVLTIGGGLS
jgi:hypothetical protein